jgi:uncharacterized protein
MVVVVCGLRSRTRFAGAGALSREETMNTLRRQNGISCLEVAGVLSWFALVGAPPPAAQLGVAPPALFAVSAPAAVKSPRASHQVVIELTSGAMETWHSVLNNVENVRKALGESVTKVEVVVHGKALGFLKTSNTEQKDRMQKLAAAGVVFAACANTMKRQQVTKEQLLPFTVIVDSGVAELVRKQESGWSYVRSAE